MNATEHFNRGLDYYNANHFDDAESEFTRAIELSPDYSDPFTGRGYVHSLNGDYDKAVSDFNDAIRLNPSDADAWKGRADARQILGDFNDAISDYNTAIHLNPHDADCFHRRGDAHTTMGSIQNAIDDYRQAIALNPANPISHYFLASHLARTQSYAGAICHYEEALRIDLDLDAFVYASYAWLLATCPDAKLRNPCTAIRLARTACENTDWCEDQELGVLAAAYAANGDLPNAVRWQRNAVEYAYDNRKQLQQTRLEAYNSGKPCVYSEEP